MKRAFYIVDAFASEPFAGNAAGVVTDASGLDSRQMQLIARELKQTETCFVAPSPEPEVDFHLRWFTPTVEVDLCGHATIAAYLCLEREGRLSFDAGRCHLRHLTRSGILDVWVTRSEDRQVRVMMSVGVPQIEPATDDPEQAAAAIGLVADDLDPELPLAVEPAGTRLIVPVRSLDRLLALQPAANAMIDYGRTRGYRRFTLACRETINPDSLVHVRHFAPANGILEDPVTGTAHATVAAYFDEQGLLPSGEHLQFVGEQGHAVRRPGMVAVELWRHDQALEDVRIGGSGSMSAFGTIADP